jgi:hypothetical protein
LHGKAHAIAAAPAAVDHAQILGGQGVVAGQFAVGEIIRYLSQLGTLVVGEQVWGMDAMGLLRS